MRIITLALALTASTWLSASAQTRPLALEDFYRLESVNGTAISPDGRQVALTIEEAGSQSPAHAWLADLARGTLTRFTFDGLSRETAGSAAI